MALTIDVIVPVRDMCDQIGECLSRLIPQCGDQDVLTVVDDASTDNTAEVARRAGARVLAMDTSRGPYFARQFAAMSSDADILLFIDGRCRALPGLVESHRSMHGRPGVMLSATETRTLGGTTLAARTAAHMQMFALRHYVDTPGRPDYYPTANLGIKREAFEKVEGFRAVRSGGDADICWRIQRHWPDCMAVDHETRMEWIPRSSSRDLLSQAYRYGKSWAHLQWLFRSDLAEESKPLPSQINFMMQKTRSRLREMGRSSIAEQVISTAYSTAFYSGYRVAKARSAEFEVPPYCGSAFR